MMVSCGLVGDCDRRRELDHVTQLDRGGRSVGLLALILLLCIALTAGAVPSWGVGYR